MSVPLNDPQELDKKTGAVYKTWTEKKGSIQVEIDIVSDMSMD